MLSLRQGQAKLREKGVNISLETIRKRLKEHNLKFRSVIKKPLLSKKHIEKRVAWARKHLDYDWENAIFTDESSFWARSTVNRAWSTPNNRFVVRTLKHPVKLHVWGCFSKRGFGKLHIFTGTLNAERMTEIYRKALLPSAKKMFPSADDPWTLVEDNDPKHRSRLCQSWKDENGVHVLEWPSQSPDANPIENVWAFMKLKMRGKKAYTVKSLATHLKLIWKSLPASYAEKLVESMHSRCNAIIASGGDWTPY